MNEDIGERAKRLMDSITAPLNQNQFEDFFLSLKIRIKQLREQRKKIKNK